LKWLYLRKTPSQQFQLAFDTEIYRQYEEYDTQVTTPQDAIAEDATKWSLSEGEVPYKKATSFRHIVSVGQMMQWDITRMKKVFDSMGASYDEDALINRIPKARAWLELYNPEEMLVVRDTINTAYAEGIAAESKKQVKALAEALEKNTISEDALEEFIYSIPKDDTLSQKENAIRQRAFFKDIYNLLISKDTGPRLATFISVIGYEKAASLLTIKE
jgi:lysyl-tRNA synthetase class 1